MPRPDRLFSILFLAAAATGTALAADPDPQKLDAVEKQLEQSQAEQARLRAQAETLAREVREAREAMIAAAKDIQDQEYSLMVLENRVTELEREAARMTDTLGRRDAQMTQVLAALERLALKPADAMALYPLSPDDAVRSAILLRAAVPGIQKSAETLQTELADLYRVRSELVAQRERIAAGAAALVEKRRTLEALAERKSGQQVALARRNQEAEARVQALAREAADLRELFEKLAAEKARREAAARKAAEAARAEEERRAEEARKAEADAKAAGRIVLRPPPGARPITPAAPGQENQVAALPPAAELRPFSQARGTMPFPVVGRLASRYGESEDNGVLSKGLIITSRPGSPVVAPFDGTVAYAGPFRGYGLLLIIEHSEGYHTLLAGFGRIDCTVGQRLFAGEPVGVMDGEDAPSLYVELRRDGQPVNPLPWLAERTGKNSG